jgi:hypothetical protein
MIPTTLMWTRRHPWCVFYFFSASGTTSRVDDRLKFQKQIGTSTSSPPDNNVSDTPRERFDTYSSPLACLPLLRARFGITLNAWPASQHSSSLVFGNASAHAPSSLGHPGDAGTQLRLSQITTLVDPKKQLCHFEVPGGGECRDAECEDVHLDRLVLAPSGASAALGARFPLIAGRPDMATYRYLTRV